MGLWSIWKVGDKKFQIDFGKIKEWLKYKDEKRFEEYIQKVIENEISKFHITKDDIDKIIKETFPEPEFKIIYPQ